MEASHVRLLVVVGLVLLVSLATVDRRVVRPAGVDPEGVTLASGSASDEGAAAEVARIREHLLRVERELLDANVAHLTVTQRANRAAHIEVLREYREHGVFPHNHRVLGRRVPVFIDDHGTPCAVGYLLARSGNEDLARRIAAMRNLARIPALADMPELVAWLMEAGLSVEEATRIQPMYDWFPSEDGGTDTGYGTATLITATLSGGAAAWNLFAGRTGERWWIPGAVGVGAGAAGVALAALGAHMNDDFDDVRASHIALNAGAGLLSSLLGVRTLHLGRAPTPPIGEVDAAPPPARLEVATWLPRGGGTGVQLGLRF